jgi:hypothetical protein
MKKTKYDEQLLIIKDGIRGVLDTQEIQNRMSAFDYPPEHINEERTLLKKTKQLTSTQDKDYSKKYAATEELTKQHSPTYSAYKIRKGLVFFIVCFCFSMQHLFALGTVNFSVSGLQSGDKSIVSIGSDSYLDTKTITVNGSYSFDSISAGKYFIKIEATGYNLPNAQTVIVHEDGSIDPMESSLYKGV